MPTSAYPAQNIHLPPHRPSVRVARIISLTGCGILSLATIALFFETLLSLHLLTPIFGERLINFPTVIALFACSSALFLYSRSNKSSILKIKVLILLGLLGVIITTIGLCTLLDNAENINYVQYLSAVDFKAGVMFLLAGMAIIVSTLAIPHRYHYMQFLIFISLFISLFGYFESMYRLVSLVTVDGQSPFWASLLFLSLSLSLVFAKPNRGFIGLFTTDTHMSQLTRMSLSYFALFPPALGFFFLVMENLGLFGVHGRLAMIVVLFIFLSGFIAWINVKLLYHSEIEHYLMKEALRIYNIKLELNTEDLSTKVGELEQAKQSVTEKLNNQSKLTDLMDSS